MKYAKTAEQLAAELNMTRQALYKGWVEKDGFPAKTKRGWNIEKCAEFIKTWKEEKETIRGAHQDLKRQKLQLECDILQEKLNELRRVTVSVEEMYDQLREVANIVNSGLKEFVGFVKVEYRESGALTKAKAIRDQVKRWLQKEIERSTDVKS